MKFCLIVFFISGFFLFTHSQTIIWSEDFSSYADGVVTGSNLNTTNPAVDWTSSGCGSCNPPAGDWWEIQSGRMEARDVNDDYCSLTTEVIDISAFPAVYFTVLCTEDGDHEGLYLSSPICIDQNNEDFADVEFRINGGAWTLVSNYLGWCGLYASCGTHTFYGDDNTGLDCRTTDDDWVSSTVQVLGLSGSTLQLRFSATNSSAAEYIQFDNITVVGYDPLPIELIDFIAIQKEDYVQLNWQTATELNNAYFVIERSTDGAIWEEIHRENGAGNSHTKIAYTSFDKSPFFGMNYYRLKQIDFDGKSSFSDIQAVLFKSEAIDFKLFPNPANETVQIYGKDISRSAVKILDSYGQTAIILERTDDSMRTVDLATMRNGVYFVQVTIHDQTTTKKLIVLH